MNPTATPDDNSRRPEAHALTCMEIWGDSAAFENYVSVPGIDAYVHCHPYEEADHGGDVHYVSQCAAGNISRFVLADVAGHGAAVAEIATVLRRLVRRNINTPDQAALTRALNNEFKKLSEDGTFATAALATYFAPSDHLILTSAGHPRPLWWSSADRQWRLVDADTPGVRTSTAEARIVAPNVPLGVIEPTDFLQTAVPLRPGDFIVIYSDAAIETCTPAGTSLGEQGLLELVRTIPLTPPHRVGPALVEKLTEHHGSDAFEDDLTLIVLHHNAADPPKLPLKERIRVLGKMLGLDV